MSVELVLVVLVVMFDVEVVVVAVLVVPDVHEDVLAVPMVDDLLMVDVREAYEVSVVVDGMIVVL
jgi:hypothetical protein